MSEPKLCPYRKTFGEKYEEHKLEIDGIGKIDSIRGELFGYCLQDECAMWRKRTEANPDCHDDVATLNEPKMIVGGYCGLAGVLPPLNP